MSKQKKIKKGMTDRLISLTGMKYAEADAIVGYLLTYQSANGVVIQVERELPDSLIIKKGAYPSMQMIGCLSSEGEWIRKTAGYVAVEPLVEE